MLAVYGPQCVIVYMGHVIPYDATSASSVRMAGTGGIYRMGPRVRHVVMGECNTHLGDWP